MNCPETISRLQTSKGEVVIRGRVEGAMIVVIALWKNLTVGRLMSVIDEKSATIGDLEVTDSADIGVGLLHRLFRSRKSQSFRRLGIGSAILRLYLTICERLEIDSVEGAVLGRDLARTPALLDWYTRHGFQKRLPSKEELESRMLPPDTQWKVVWTRLALCRDPQCNT